jgi:uncharacterized protein (TIGR00725 family)
MADDLETGSPEITRAPAGGPQLAAVTVGVMGSGINEHRQLAEPLGELLASLHVNLLTGAGGGVMRAVARGYSRVARTTGISIGIVPCESLAERSRPGAGYPNEFVELPILTHLPLSGVQGTHDLSRNHVNVLTPAVIIVLPGAAGTASEVALALRYRKPVAIFCPDADRVRNLPPEVPRLLTLDRVREFINAHSSARC